MSDDLLTMLEASFPTAITTTTRTPMSIIPLDIDYQLQSLTTELGMVRGLRDEAMRPMNDRVHNIEARIADLLAYKKAGVTGPASGLYDDLVQLEHELNVVLAQGDDVQQRNRKAIDLHGKLDRATGDLQALKDQGVDIGTCDSFLSTLLDRLLAEVFNIPTTRTPAPSKVSPATARKVAGYRKAAAKATKAKAPARKTKATPKVKAKSK